ncbi:hypothetical protein [Microbacterium sp. NPDC091676]|uniref:hypothetical protein n=1 Tax=Microbacterium sp. NPDC091676 TaxID=3364212 RepID=UPI0037F3089A
MAKYTPLSVQNELTSRIHGYHQQASEAKKDYYAKRDAILNDSRLSAEAKDEDAAKLLAQTVGKLASILEDQKRYVDGLKSSLEKELRGSLPQDANSIMLRRDAAQRARQVTDERDALAILQDAVRTGDETMAHAIGIKARNTGWFDVAEAWQQAHPDTAGLAEALAFVEDATSGGAYNLANGAAYSSPAA